MANKKMRRKIKRLDNRVATLELTVHSLVQEIATQRQEIEQIRAHRDWLLSRENPITRNDDDTLPWVNEPASLAECWPGSLKRVLLSWDPLIPYVGEPY